MEGNRLSKKDSTIEFLGKYGIGFFTILVAVFFGTLEPAFFKGRNLLNILSSACVTGIAGMGITCIYASGELDFGAGIEVATGACSMALLLRTDWCNSYALAIVLTLLIMVGIGLMNSFFHIVVGIPAFVSTLGVSFLVKGVLKYLTNGGGIYALPQWPKAFTFVGQGYLFGVIPMPVIVLVAVSVVMLLFTERTKWGKYIYAVGVNSKACNYLGISAKLQKTIAFVLCSVICGIAGIVQGSMLNGCLATMGDAIFTQALTVLMFGALFLKSGVYNVPGTLVGALLYTIILNGMTLCNTPAWAKEVVQGALLLVALCLVASAKLRKDAR